MGTACFDCSDGWGSCEGFSLSGTAFGATEWAFMKSKGMKLVWSPASNMALYKKTTNVPLALDKGILVSVAPDWSMGGSPNMLDELRGTLGRERTLVSVDIDKGELRAGLRILRDDQRRARVVLADLHSRAGGVLGESE